MYLEKSRFTIFISNNEANDQIKMKRYIFTSLQKLFYSICFILFLGYPSKGISSNNIINFLPMEDALSTSRNINDNDFLNVKPYNEPLPLKKDKSESNIFKNIDLLAFFLLAIVFFLIVNRKSRPRNISL